MGNTEVFKNKSFTLLFLGKMVSDLGDQIFNLAVGWHILKITNSAFQMSIYISIGTIIHLLLGPYGGVIADRVDRIKIIYMADIIRGITLLSLTLIMYMGIESIGVYYISSAVISICGAFFYPASMSIIPDVVEEEELTNANSLISMIQSFSSSVGLLMGGLLYGVVGIRGVFIINALTYLISGIWEMFIKTRKCTILNENHLKNSVFKDLQEAFVIIKKEKSLYLILTFSIVLNFFITPLIVIFIPYMLNQHLKTEPIALSFVQGAGSAGYILGAMMLPSLSKISKSNKRIVTGTILYSATTLMISILLILNFKGLVNVKYLIIYTIVSMGAMGIFNAIINITINILMQKIVLKKYLGRVNALSSTMVMAVTPISMVLGGRLVDKFSLINLMFITALSLIFISLIFSFKKEIINVQ